MTSPNPIEIAQTQQRISPENFLIELISRLERERDEAREVAENIRKSLSYEFNDFELFFPWEK